MGLVWVSVLAAPKSLWHFLLVKSLKASACLPRHIPPQYPWLKCDWCSQCRANLATQRLCWVMLISQTRRLCFHDWKQNIMQSITNWEIWELWIHNETVEMKLQIVLSLSFCALNMHLGSLRWAWKIYSVNGAGSNRGLFVRPWNNISVPWLWSFACI